MSFITRLVLTIPITLSLLQYFVLGMSVIGNPEVASFWGNHALRESIFAMFLGAVVLNHIWSNANPPRVGLIALFGSPLIFGFWLANFSIGFGDFALYQNVYLNHVMQAVLFIVGLLMVMSNQVAFHQAQKMAQGPGGPTR